MPEIEEPEPGTPELSLSTKVATFTEGTTLVIQVALKTAPTSNVTVSFAKTTNKVTLDKESMTFTNQNYSAVQYLTLSYTGQALSGNETDTVNITCSGAEYEGIKDSISVTILKKDVEPEPEPEPEPDQDDIFTHMRAATKEDFAPSANVGEITISEDGTVQVSATATYGGLMVNAVGDTAAIEWESVDQKGMWILAGKYDGKNDFVGFGDMSMGTLTYYGLFLNGSCSAQSGVSADAGLSFTCAAGNKYRLSRVGTRVKCYQWDGSKYELRFSLDLASFGSVPAESYAVNAVGLCVGGSYHLPKNVKVYTGR